MSKPVLIGLLACLPLAGWAAPVHLHATGTVSSVTGTGAPAIGAPVQVEFVVDDDASVYTLRQPAFPTYLARDLTGGPYGGLVTIPSISPVASPSLTYEVFDNDLFPLGAPPGDAVVLGTGFPGGRLFLLLVGPETGFSGVDVLDAATLGSFWTSARLQGFPGRGLGDWTFVADVTSLTVQASTVDAPPPLAGVLAGLAAMGAWRRRHPVRR